MTDSDAAADNDLYQRTQALLEPGEIELVGLIIDTELSGDREPQLHQETIAIGDIIAEHAGYEPTNTFVYSGNDDSDFGMNQHQGLTVEGDEFVWECQQLIREGTYAIVFYYEADVDQDAVVEAVREEGYDAYSVETE